MPAYQIYRGDVFELVDQATSFVMSRIDNWVGTRTKGESASIPTHPELPIDAVKEAKKRKNEDEEINDDIKEEKEVVEIEKKAESRKNDN